MRHKLVHKNSAILCTVMYQRLLLLSNRLHSISHQYGLLCFQRTLAWQLYSTNGSERILSVVGYVCTVRWLNIHIHPCRWRSAHQLITNFTYILYKWENSHPFIAHLLCMERSTSALPVSDICCTHVCTIHGCCCLRTFVFVSTQQKQQLN